MKKLLVLSLVILIGACSKDSRTASGENEIPIYAQGGSATISAINADCYADWNNGVDTNRGTDSFPKKHIQACINAVINGQTVIAKPGTYVENINFSGKNITVASNFINTNAAADIDNTIIDGNQSGVVVEINNLENNNARLIGFTIQNGFCYRCNGGGIGVINAAPTLKNLKVINNRTEHDRQQGGSGGIGGGICIEPVANSQTAVVLENILVSDNFSSAQGGGLSIVHGGYIAPTIRNIKVINNFAQGRGGGIYINNALEWDLVLDKLYIVGNTSPEDPGISIDANPMTNAVPKKITIINSLIAKNGGEKVSCPYVYGGGGITIRAYVVPNLNVEIINSTIADNIAHSASGCGIYIREESGASGTTLSLLNTILWGNKHLTSSAPQGENCQVYASGTSNLKIINSDIQRLSSGGMVHNTTPSVYNSIDSDPLFIDPANNNYSIKTISPCVNTGANSFSINGQNIPIPPKDIIDVLRPSPSVSNADIGAYEVKQTVPNISGTVQTGRTGSMANIPGARLNVVTNNPAVPSTVDVSSGSYSFPVNRGDNVSIRPVLSGWTFTPPVVQGQINNNTTYNFIGTPPRPTPVVVVTVPSRPGRRP